jgi:hypothetical protein
LTTEDALNLIKAEIGGDDSEVRNRIARAALTGAIGAFNRLGEYWWNQQSVTFTLAQSATGRFETADLWPNYTVRRIEPEIWFVGKNRSIKIVGIERFNDATKHRSTTSGTPEIGAIHSRESVLEVWPVPSEAFSCSVMLYFLANSITDIPIEYHDLVIDRACMIAVRSTFDNRANPAWLAYRDSWVEGKKEIEAMSKMTAWTGNQIGADPFVTQSTTRSERTPDSGALTGY